MLGRDAPQRDERPCLRCGSFSTWWVCRARAEPSKRYLRRERPAPGEWMEAVGQVTVGVDGLCCACRQLDAPAGPTPAQRGLFEGG